jgi:hypothetical protein
MSNRKKQDDAAAMLASLGQRQPQRGSETKVIDAPQETGKQTSKQANKQILMLVDLDERPTAFSTYLRPSLQKKIKRMALELDRTTASLIEEAVEDLLLKSQG